MDLGAIYNYVNFVLNKESNGEPYTIVHFNTVLPEVCQECFNDIIKAYETSKTNSDQIAPFKVVIGNDTTPLLVDSKGKAKKPTDYFRSSSMTYKYSDNGEVKYSPVTELTDGEFAVRKGSSLLKPTFEYPIVTTRDGHFEFMPTNLQYIDLTYIKKLTTPKYGYYINSFGEPVFMAASSSHTLSGTEEGENGEVAPVIVNSTTIDLVFTEDVIPTIIYKLLIKGGLRIEQAEVVKFEMMEQQQNKTS